MTAYGKEGRWHRHQDGGSTVFPFGKWFHKKRPPRMLKTLDRDESSVDELEWLSLQTAASGIITVTVQIIITIIRFSHQVTTATKVCGNQALMKAPPYCTF